MGKKRKKNPAAVALGKLGGKARAKALTAEERSAIGKLAAAGRNNALTPEERSAISRRAAQARWGERKQNKK